LAKVIGGDRVGRDGQIRCGVSAFVQDPQGRLLLTRRSDNGRWCLPGGHLDPGESAAEGCVREVQEETGLEIEILRLIGVYSSPDFLVVFQDGNQVQFVSLCFEGRITGGSMTTSSETTEVGFYDQEQIAGLDVMETHLARISDGIQQKEAAFVR
jgi:ADP-ribose pyrophosphatase YjhB (NUDIX family)